jgi:hypothetical protein
LLCASTCQTSDRAKFAITNNPQRFTLKPKPRKILKALQGNAFKIFLGLVDW